VTEPAYLRAIRASYDTIAVDYAERYRTFLATSPLDRAMLAAFADLVQAADGGLVADLGCGPGHLTAYLDGLGVPVLGVDLSPKMVEIARQAYPGLRFREGSMTALDLPDGELGGILAWYSTHHLPPAELPAVFAEFRRTLAPGGYLLLGIHVGDEHLHAHQAYGHPVSYDSYLLPPDRVAGLLAQAGLVVTARLLREPDEKRKRPQACLLARKPGPATSLPPASRAAHRGDGPRRASGRRVTRRLHGPAARQSGSVSRQEPASQAARTSLTAPRSRASSEILASMRSSTVSRRQRSVWHEAVPASPACSAPMTSSRVSPRPCSRRASRIRCTLAPE
jgi:SAM-dependent methyltransferase